jgi:S-formylglutathione hydrolase FrmB
VRAPDHTVFAISLLAALITSTSGAVAEAEPSFCAGVLCGEPPYESARVVPLEVGGFHANVLLPPGYDLSNRRFAVLYLLHGGGGNENTWLTNTDVEAFTGTLPEAEQAIVVMPAGGPGSVWGDWDNGYYSRETWFFETLIPYIDSNFRTIADRSQRAIAGLSGGGYGAMHFAARHPDVFIDVGSFSGVLDIASPEGQLISAAAATLQYACDGHPERADPFGDNGDPLTNEVFIRNHNPLDLARNLRDLALYVATGNGLPCDGNLMRDLMCMIAPPLLTIAPLYDSEPAVHLQAERFHQTLASEDIEHVYDAGCGIHSYPYFQGELHAFWSQMHDAFGAPPPDAFNYRTADGSFSVWGWSFRTDPARAAEFLDVADASCNGLGLTGSGRTTVTTAPCFAVGETVSLDAAVEQTAIADAEGRIRLTVDLGPAHSDQQFTLPQKLLEAQGSYFTSRAVTLKGTP